MIRGVATLLTGLAILLTSPGVNADQTVWVFFKDKGIAADQVRLRLDDLRTEWPARSLANRMKNGAELTEADLPVSPDYLEALASAGCRIRAASRWLNAASLLVSADDLPNVEQLPFVVSVKRVAVAISESLPAGDEIEEISFNPDYAPAVGWGEYGPSFRQTELAGAIEAHRRGLTGKGVLIGMLDSGYQLDHRALAGLDLVGQYDFIFGDDDPSWDARTDPRGQAAHGTACLSVIAGYEPGKLTGIAPRASFALGKSEFTGSEKRVEEDWWVAGIEWLEWLGADVVSSSLTYRDWYRADEMDGETPLVTRAAQRAAELGMIICISAGNAGPRPVTIGAPADAPDVIAVAAADSNGSISSFSSRGPSADGRIKPDIAAMGRKVVCVSPGSFDRYARWNGTSLACPIVAGVAALVIEAHPDWPAAKVREALRETASKAFSPDDSAGYGLVNCEEALDYPSLGGRVLGLAPNWREQGVYIVFASLERMSDAPDPLRIDERYLEIASDGRFRVANLADGRYRLTLMCATKTGGAGISAVPQKSFYFTVPPSVRLTPSIWEVTGE